ncbi:hypothetical protein [Xaviernesmea oryzae]|uniref:Uncharacterized protein n=1 Tax=Xaviernesmea oryzae TaxID=464029 RepID=A0A1X7DTB9_9HYPH|nr:hypothetical protein [Xaviernesmea oryzae]SMF20870.1 hypothetical protein SAMN02982989_5797 [Xaviernesmea oryzae]
MEQHAVDQLKAIAKINRTYPCSEMSRNERLERWAEVLERDPDRSLNTLRETEYQPADMRAAMRDDGTAISVAFADPILREAGLQNDTYGEAKRFFELTDWQLHRLVCFCHFGGRVSSGTIAHHVRLMAARETNGIIGRLFAFFGR